MTIVANLDNVKKWIEEHICSEIEFKKPDDENYTEEYKYELIKPSVFVHYLPSNKFPNTAPSIPSICVQLESGNDSIIEKRGELNIRLGFSTWNPGMHIKEHDNKVCNINFEGWRDAWNFVDLALEKIENSEFIGGLRLVKENNIEFTPLSEQDPIPQFFPYWYAQVTFTLERSVLRTKEIYSNLLD